MLVGSAELEPVLRGLFAAQIYAVLGTQGAERVSLNLMAVSATEDLRSLVLATERATSKHASLGNSPRVSMLVDGRSSQAADTQTVLTLTMDGLAEEVMGTE
jgi:hypothetical protein